MLTPSDQELLQDLKSRLQALAAEQFQSLIVYGSRVSGRAGPDSDMDEDYADAASKAYYAMFSAAQALLRAHNFEVMKHSEVASILGREFAKTGRLDARFHRMLLQARRIRELAD